MLFVALVIYWFFGSIIYGILQGADFYKEDGEF